MFPQASDPDSTRAGIKRLFFSLFVLDNKSCSAAHSFVKLLVAIDQIIRGCELNDLHLLCRHGFEFMSKGWMEWNGMESCVIRKPENGN